MKATLTTIPIAETCSRCGAEDDDLCRHGYEMLCTECVGDTLDYLSVVLAFALDDLPPLYATEGTPLEEKTTTARFSVLGSSWEWYPVEFDRKTGICFGFVKGDFNEWGYFSLHELASLPYLICQPLDDVNVLQEALGE